MKTISKSTQTDTFTNEDGSRTLVTKNITVTKTHTLTLETVLNHIENEHGSYCYTGNYNLKDIVTGVEKEGYKTVHLSVHNGVTGYTVTIVLDSPIWHKKYERTSSYILKNEIDSMIDDCTTEEKTVEKTEEKLDKIVHSSFNPKIWEEEGTIHMDTTINFELPKEVWSEIYKSKGCHKEGYTWIYKLPVLKAALEKHGIEVTYTEYTFQQWEAERKEIAYLTSSARALEIN